MSQQVMIEWDVWRGRHSRDSPGLPTDNKREDERQERTVLRLVVDFAGTDTSPFSEMDNQHQSVELFDIQRPRRRLLPDALPAPVAARRLECPITALCRPGMLSSRLPCSSALSYLELSLRV